MISLTILAIFLFIEVPLLGLYLCDKVIDREIKLKQDIDLYDDMRI